MRIAFVLRLAAAGILAAGMLTPAPAAPVTSAKPRGIDLQAYMRGEHYTCESRHSVVFALSLAKAEGDYAGYPKNAAISVDGKPYQTLDLNVSARGQVWYGNDNYEFGQENSELTIKAHSRKNVVLTPAMMKNWKSADKYFKCQKR